MFKSTIQALPSKRVLLMAGATAALALAALGFSGGAQARSDVAFSIGVGIPGVQVGVSNAYPVYSQPVYVQPQPVYVEPRPVYVQPRPVYVQPAPVYYAPAPVYYGRPYGWNRRDRHRDRHDDRDYRRGGQRQGAFVVQGQGYYGR